MGHKPAKLRGVIDHAARDGADMGHSKSSLEGLGYTQHETGKRELESLSKPLGSKVEHLLLEKRASSTLRC